MADTTIQPALSACPRCRAPLVTKTGRNGAWQECSKRPACRFKQDVGGAPHEARPAPPKPIGYRPGCLPLPAGMVLPASIVLDEHQQRASAWREGLAVVAAAAGCHPAGTRVMRADGKCVPVETVAVGDRLMGPGGPRVVQRLHRGFGKIYRITLKSGEFFDANSEHLLTLRGLAIRGAPRRVHNSVVDVEVERVTTEHLKWYAAVKAPVAAFEDAIAPAELPIPPYFLGVLIGDGSFNHTIQVGKPDPEIEAACRENAPLFGLTVRKYQKGTRCPIYYLVNPKWRERTSQYEKSRLRVALETVGLFGKGSLDRFVPRMYLTTTRHARLELLAGLLDTDGHLYMGLFTFVSRSKQLAEDVTYLARSLGFDALLRQRVALSGFSEGKPYFELRISGETARIPTRIARKRAPERQRSRLGTHLRIQGIEFIGNADYYGFTINEDGRYLLSDFTVTHNSGKTAVLIDRVCSLLAEGWIPEAICALAYNRGAADTLHQRLAIRVGKAADRVGIHTFHAWAYALLRHWYPTEPRLSRGRILGTPEAPHPVKLAAPLIDELKLDISWGTALDCASRCAEALVDIDAMGASIEIARCMGWAPRTGEVAAAVALKSDRFHRFCLAWRERKQREGLIEFSDMLGEVALAMRRHPMELAYLGRLYSHVMIDECQDINPSREVIARFLGREARSLMFVGDLRQSIYGFSGARPDLFLDIAHDENATLLTLPVNRRSTQRIVEAANAVADGEPWNLGGACVARPGAPVGEVVQTWVQSSPSEEARDVIADIQRRVGAGRSLGTVADPTYCCLARTNAMLVSLEHAFVARNVPCRLAGSPGGVWASEVGEQMLQYLEAVEGVPSFGVVKIANHPKRFAKKAEVGEAVEQAQAAEQQGQKPTLHARLEAKGGGAGRLGRDLARAGAMTWNRRVLQCARWLGLDDDEEIDGDEDRRACLEALVGLTQQLGSLGGIYDFKTAASRGEKEPAVLLSTIHRSKGSEHPVVYVCGVRAKALPHQKCEDKAEEKRLLYVAVTRARDVLVLSTGGKASEFLVELGWANDLEEKR